jgi:DNA polymerase-3 subunit gamma/tau
MSQALYRKYRPRGWAEVIGQDHIVQTLRNAIVANRVGHAYLFAGPRGTGKTTLARILAKAVNCTADDPNMRPCNQCAYCVAVNENRFLDLIEMDAASNTGVDDVRDLREKINFSPSQGRYKIHLIDEVHMLSTAAFNALLKTLEEPPAHAIFILATTEIQKIPATVLSRCQRHEFRRVAVDEILSNLQHIVQTEGLRADEDALLLIARQATGSVRDAQSLLDQLASVGTNISLETAQKVLGTATSQAVLDLVDAMQKQAAGPGFETLHRALDSGADPRTLARQVVEYLRSLLLLEMGGNDQVEVAKDLRERMGGQAEAFRPPTLLRMIRSFNAAAMDTRGGWQPSLSLELALAEAFDHEPDGNSSPSGSSGGPAEPSLRPNMGNRPGPSITQRGGPAGGRSGMGEPFGRTMAHQAADQRSPAPAAGNQNGPIPLEATGEASDGTGASLIQIARAWKDVRALIKPAHPAVEALLNSCKPVEIRGSNLLLGFQSETVRGLMDKPEHLQVTSAAIEELLGLRLQVKCVVINARGKLPPNVAQDGMVATALNHGGEIVDVQD